MGYEYHKNLLGNDLHPPKFLTGVGDPTESGGPTPTYIGQIYFDTDGNVAYIANGTSSNANWQMLYDTTSADARYVKLNGETTNITNGTFNLTTTGTLDVGNTTIAGSRVLSDMVLSITGADGILGSIVGQGITITTGIGYSSTASPSGSGGYINLFIGSGGALDTIEATGTLLAGSGGTLNVVTGKGGKVTNTGDVGSGYGGSGGPITWQTDDGGGSDGCSLGQGGTGGSITWYTGHGGDVNAYTSGLGGAGGGFSLGLGHGGIGYTVSGTAILTKGGKGGSYTITAGDGGSTTNAEADNGTAYETGGAGGDITFEGGVGGETYWMGYNGIGGKGGSIFFTAGLGGESEPGTGGAGGDITLTAGLGNNGYIANGADGKILLMSTTNVDTLTASKVVFTSAAKDLTSTGIGTSSQFIKADGSLDSTTYYKSGDSPTFTNVTVTSTLKILEGGSGPTNYTNFIGGEQTGDITYTLPIALPATNSLALICSTAGIMSWSTNFGANNILTSGTLGSSTHTIGGATGVTLAGALGVLTLAGIGGTYNENLTIDFDGVASNTVYIGSDTGVNTIDFGTTINLYAGFVRLQEVYGYDGSVGAPDGLGLTIAAGNAYNVGNNAGGELSIYAGNASGSGTGGDFYFEGGNSVTGNAGSSYFTGGDTGGAGLGGNITLAGGAGGTAGSVIITGKFNPSGITGGINWGSQNFSSVGTLGAGAITGTSFIIAAHTLDENEWHYLDGIDQALKTSDSPTFNQGDFTTLHTTTILADHIGEHTGSHTVVFDNSITATTIIIGANTVNTSEWAYLDGLDQAVKTTDGPTFDHIHLTNTLNDATYSLSVAEISNSAIEFYFKAPAANEKIVLRAPFAFNWTNIIIHSEGTTNYVVTLDIWTDTTANWPPTVADTIFTTAPALANPNSGLGTAITSFVGGKGSVAVGDYIICNVKAVTGTVHVGLSCQINKT